MDVKNRFPENLLKTDLVDQDNDFPSKHPKSVPSLSVVNLGVNFWAVMFVMLGLGFFLAAGFQTSCSLSWPSSSISSDVDARLEESRIRVYLREATVGGHRPVGSKNNEEVMPKYLLNVLREHMAINGGHLRTEIDEQIAHFASFDACSFAFGCQVFAYQNIRNIVFRIRDPTKSDIRKNSSAILVNCHYDSVVDSPGASDDFVSCASMLEVIRVLLTAKIHLKHDLIFLFNGAEESGLLGSHAFVTQHPWMKDVRMFINLEAAGSGGRQAVFQAGPKSPWIIREYAATSKQPFGSIVMQEVFEMGIIPSDTDFRIFRDFGGVPGIDIAYFANGYAYHTNFDREERIPPMCIQNAGDNILHFVLRLSNSSHLGDSGDDNEKDIVFFDFVGLFFVHYSTLCSFLLNILCILLVAVRFVYYAYLDHNHAKHVAFALLNHLVCLLCILALLLLQGYFMFYVGSGMSWYAVRYNLVGVYIFPLLWVFFNYHGFILHKNSIWPNSQIAEFSHFCAAQILLCVPLLILTFYNFRSSHILLIMVGVPFFARLLLNRVDFSRFDVIPAPLFEVCKQVVMLGLPWVFLMYCTYSAFELFIPVMGRTGTSLIPDVFIAFLIFISSIVGVTYLAGKVYQTSLSSLHSIRFLLLHSTLSFLILIHFTNFGFPYNGSYEIPCKQRFMIQHVNRVFRDKHSTTEAYDSGLFVVPLDRNLVQHVKNHVPELQVTKPSLCGLEPYCGFPYMRSVASFFTHSYYLPRGPHKMSPPVDLTLIDKVGLDRSTFNLTFSIAGPSQTQIYFMVEPGVNLISWSFGSGKPMTSRTPRNSPENHFFVSYNYGHRPQQPLTFWIVCTASTSQPSDKARVRIALGGHYAHQPGYRTPELQGFIEHLPDWVVPTAWSSTYERWTVLLRRGARYIK